MVAREVTRRAPPAATVAAPAAGAVLSRAGGGRVRVEWDATRYAAAMIRDAATGQVLSFARGGRVDVESAARELEVVLSDGVSSVRRMVQVSR
jgi:hypothetical protein